MTSPSRVSYVKRNIFGRTIYPPRFVVNNGETEGGGGKRSPRSKKNKQTKKPGLIRVNPAVHCSLCRSAKWSETKWERLAGVLNKVNWGAIRYTVILPFDRMVAILRTKQVITTVLVQATDHLAASCSFTAGYKPGCVCHLLPCRITIILKQ